MFAHKGRQVVAAAAATTLVLTGLSARSSAAPTIDGTLDAADYGSAIVVQTTQTGFGDATDGDVSFANGSELDNAYAKVSGGNLYLFLGGNLQNNFNKLEIFFDTIAGGQNRLRADFAPTIDQPNTGAKLGGDGINTGMRFDVGFVPDFYLGVTVGGGNRDTNTPNTLYANYSAFTADAPGVDRYLGGSDTLHMVDAFDATNNPGGTNIEAALNNSNIAGVGGGTGPDSGAGVSTGIELLIPLAKLGNPTGPIKVSAFINGGQHDYLSNQSLAPFDPGTSNPAGDNFGGYTGSTVDIDFQLFNGDQFFTVPNVTRITGDTNGDGVVDLSDLNNVLNNFGSHTAGSPGDDNGDGVVDLTDLNNVLNNFGAHAAAGALSAVPEPAGVALAAVVATALTRGRRRVRR